MKSWEAASLHSGSAVHSDSDPILRTRSVTITGITAEGDRVAYEAVGEMVFPDRVYRNIYHNLVVIRDGLIVEGREYMDPGPAASHRK